MELFCTFKVIRTLEAMLVMVTITPNSKYELIPKTQEQLLM